MTPQQFVGLVVRLFAIWLVVFSFQVFGILKSTLHYEMAEIIGFLYIFMAIVIILAILFWAFPMAIAHKLIPRTQFENTIQLPAQEVVHVACIIFGLYLILVRVLPSLAYNITLLLITSRNKQLAMMYEDHITFLKIAPILIEFIVAVAMLFKSQALSKYLLSEAK